MVNFEKHNQNKVLIGQLPIENTEIMNELGKETINLIVTEPDKVITNLKGQYDELNNYYDMLNNQ